MAKKVNKNHQVAKAKVAPGTQNQSAQGKNLGKVIGAACLLMFVVVEELWMASAGCALAFAVLFFLHVFREKSATWYSSGYLYATVGMAVLSYLEYSTRIISGLLDLRS